jgi:23S rRNA (guanosine2251-2'-O)-methyltransferase
VIIYGRQPVREAFRSGQVQRVLLANGIEAKAEREFRNLAARANVPTDMVPKIALNQTLRTGRHQGVAAELGEVSLAEPETPIQLAKERGEFLLLVVLDQVQDPRNYGAIIRSAEALGAHGVVSEQRRGAPLSAIAVKTSAGATAHLPIVQVTNLVRYLKTLKRQNVWIYGALTATANTVETIDWKRDAALIIGSEGRGLRRLVTETCDDLVSIPLSGKSDSLNASVAAGILLHDIQASRRNNP